MSVSPYGIGSSPVVGVSCREGHFVERRRQLSSPLFPVALAAMGVIVDFLWILPGGAPSLYAPLIALNVLGAWLVIRVVAHLRERIYPLPRLCPVCDGPLDQFLGMVDTKGGPNAIEVTSTLVFIILHITASLFT